METKITLRHCVWLLFWCTEFCDRWFVEEWVVILKILNISNFDLLLLNYESLIFLLGTYTVEAVYQDK